MGRWLLKVEPIGPSLAVYAPLAIFDKALTLGRVVLFTWVLTRPEYGIWGLGTMVFGVLAHLMVLGTDEGIARYVSYYQARGRLAEMFRRVSLGAVVVAVCVSAAAAACSGLVGSALRAAAVEEPLVSPEQMRAVVLLGVLNAMLMGLFHGLQACLRAMRTLRLLGVINLAYTVLFTGLTVALWAVRPTGLAVLSAHAASLAAMLALGWLAARVHVAGQPVAPAPAPGESVETTGVMARIIRFGIVAMLAGLTWHLGSHVTSWFIQRRHGTDVLGGYMPYWRFCQPVWILSAIVWPVVFGYVANHWESGRRYEALRLLRLAYKLTVLGLMTVSILILITAPLWSRALQPDYRVDLAVVAGLLMFFQCSANLGMAAMAAKLRERPAAIVLIIALGAVVNVVLAAAWVPVGGAVSAAVVGGARAAGIGMLCACGAGAAYLAVSRFRVHPAAYVLSLSPALLLLPAAAAAGVWAVLLGLSAATPWVLTAPEKRALRHALGGIIARWRGSGRDV